MSDEKNGDQTEERKPEGAQVVTQGVGPRMTDEGVDSAYVQKSELSM